VKRAAVVLLLVLTAAFATGCGKRGYPEGSERNAVDEKAAQVATIRRSDLTAGDWTGGPQTPSLLPEACKDPRLDLSAIVRTGEAAAGWGVDASQLPMPGGYGVYRSLDVSSETHVFRTAEMLRQKFRIVHAPTRFECVRKTYLKRWADGRPEAKVSYERIPFPRVAPYVVATRVVVQHPESDTVFQRVAFGKGRTYIHLEITAKGFKEWAITAAAVRYAKILVRRIKT
jgi:hypothetical protein